MYGESIMMKFRKQWTFKDKWRTFEQIKKDNHPKWSPEVCYPCACENCDLKIGQECPWEVKD